MAKTATKGKTSPAKGTGMNLKNDRYVKTDLYGKATGGRGQRAVAEINKLQNLFRKKKK